METSFELDPVSKRSLFKAFKTMDDNAKTLLKDEVASITGWLARDMKQAALSAPKNRQAQIVADSIVSRRDRMPYIQAGGRKSRATSTGTPSGVLLYGSEFGSNRYRQFPWRSPRMGRGSAGYFIYPTLRAGQARLTREWKSAVERFVINPWGRA